MAADPGPTGVWLSTTHRCSNRASDGTSTSRQKSKCQLFHPEPWSLALSLKLRRAQRQSLAKGSPAAYLLSEALAPLMLVLVRSPGRLSGPSVPLGMRRDAESSGMSGSITRWPCVGLCLSVSPTRGPERRSCIEEQLRAASAGRHGPSCMHSRESSQKRRNRPPSIFGSRYRPNSQAKRHPTKRMFHPITPCHGIPLSALDSHRASSQSMPTPHPTPAFKIAQLQRRRKSTE